MVVFGMHAGLVQLCGLYNYVNVYAAMNVHLSIRNLHELGMLGLSKSVDIIQPVYSS